MKNSNNALLGLFIAIGLSLGGYFISQTIYNSKVAMNTAEAKGLAERRVKANLANWTLSFKVESDASEDISTLYATAEAQQKRIITLIKENGFTDDEIGIGVIDYDLIEYRDSNQEVVDRKHSLSGYIGVETQKVDHVATARANVNKLIAEGINIENNPPAYLFTELNNIKPEMLREATENARIAANEFAQIAGVSVGGIRSARQGNFFIRDAGSDYGDTQKIEKDVRVVTTIKFYLTE